MSIIRVNGKEPTIKSEKEQELLTKIFTTIREFFPGMSDILAVEIITEKQRAVRILAYKPEKAIDDQVEKDPSPMEPIQTAYMTGHPCLGCETLSNLLGKRKTE